VLSVRPRESDIATPEATVPTAAGGLLVVVDNDNNFQGAYNS